MLWKDGRRSSNVLDKRGRRISGGAKKGGIGILLLALVGLYFGIDPALIMNIAGNIQQPTSGQAPSIQQSAAEKELADFVSVVLADTEDSWKTEFQKRGASYKEPRLVLFTGSAISMRFWQSCHGTFLLPWRPASLYRSFILQRLTG